MAFVEVGKLTDTTSALHPEMLDELRKLKEAKKASKILIRANELRWSERTKQNTRSARLIDPRNGFANSVCNLAIAEVAPRGRTGKHKHTEAYVYILKGRGYSIIDDKRYEWSEGDAIYVPPDAFHQHFNESDEPVRYLRILPGPLVVNLLAVLASLNASFEGALVQAETAPEYQGPQLKSYFR